MRFPRLVSVCGRCSESCGHSQQITGYDALGRITGSSETVDGTAAGSFSYTYNLADALVSTTYPSGRVVTNTYDGANRISAVTGSGKTYIGNAIYTAFGAIGGFNYAVTSGVAAGARTFSYNGRMQPGEMSDQGSSLLDLKYYYGNASTAGSPGASSSANNGNPAGVVEKAKKGAGAPYTPYTFTQTYGYDSVNRLKAASDSGGWAQNFSFDQYGNPWTTANSGLPPDRLPTANVYTPATNRSTDAGITYDSAGAGNQITMGSAQLTFDAENRIVQSYDTTTHNSTCFGYDALGERVYKQTFGGNTCTGTAGTTVVYVYDAFGNLMRQVETATVSGALPPTPCLTCYLTWDHLGSVRMVSDTVSGGFTAFHDYAPFGAEVLNNAGRTADWGSGTDYLSQRYTGAERDAETTLDFLQARYLANQQARFLSADPAGNAVADLTNPQSWNMYGYVYNNPLKFIDPTGLACVYAGADNGTADYGDPTNYIDDNNGGQSCADAFASPPQTLTVNDNNSWLNQVSSWWNDSGSDGGGTVFSTTVFGQSVSGQAQQLVNGVKSLFGYDQNDPRPSCFGGFVSNTLSNLNPVSPSLSSLGEGVGGLYAASKFNQALTYAASKPSVRFGTKFLMYPNKSSVFRSLLKQAGKTGKVTAAASVVLAESQALWDEIQSMQAGRCQ